MTNRVQHILVTGGAGFVGRNFVRLALDAGYRITVLDKLTYSGHKTSLEDFAADEYFDFIHGGIEQKNEIAQLVSSQNEQKAFDAVINFAAETHVDRSIDDPDIFIQSNVVGVQTLISALMRHQKPTENFRFIQISTDEVFGSADDYDFDENSPYKPNSPYAASKAAADHVVRAAHKTYGFPSIITNCSNNFGPFQFPEKLIPLLIIKALNDELLPVYGDGRQIRDWLFVDDHCKAILKVLQKGRIGETYMIGARNCLENIGVVETICASLDKLSPRQNKKSYTDLISFVADRPGHDRRYAVNPSKIEALLGWAPQTTFEEGLHSTVTWYIENQPWWMEILDKTYHGERLGNLNMLATQHQQKVIPIK